MPLPTEPPAADAPADGGYQYSGPAALRAPIDAALRQVIDPEVAMHIVDVGLVQRIDIDDAVAHLVMTMTSAACPVTDLIVEDVQAALDSVLPEALAIRVELVWEPPWTPARMSPAARARMGWTGPDA
jgi:metal-sulfur cluster biosynthetic enzyme